MRPQPHTQDLGLGPVASFEEALAWSAHALLCVGAGTVLGVACSHAMRRASVHWSWAAGSCALLLAARPAPTSGGCVVCVALLTAAVRGRRWHREDRVAGADLGELAARRVTPLDVALALVRSAIARRRDAARNGKAVADDGLALGRDERGRRVTIPLGAGGGGTHALIVGATGSGKTVTQASIVERAVAQGMGAIVIDPKGDRKMRETLARAAWREGRRFIEWTPDGPSVYNPYARGTDTEIADKVLASERFTEPHYQRQAQRYVGHVVRAFREADEPVSLRAIVHHLDPHVLELLVRTLPGTEDGPHATHAYLDSLTRRQASDLAGVRDRLAILAESDLARWLDPATAGGEQFDVLEAVRARAVVYVGLDADSRPLLAQMLGGAIVQDLQTAVAALQRRPVPTLAVIDEFSALGTEHVVRLFGRARSAGVSLVLGTQELADLRVAGRERLLEQVLGNVSVLIAHRLLVPDSASFIASMSGSQGVWRTSSHGDGRITRTRIRQPVLGAEQLVSLHTGTAAVLVLSGSRDARIVRVTAPASVV
jgi:type IV secretory pathway TraG/TraD family ATPase VirD4